MASNRIKGITIEIDGNTTKLTDSLKDVDKALKDTQNQLKDVNKLLKMDPGNVELLRQKHELLGKAVTDTKKRQEELKKALEDSKKAGDTEENRHQQDLLQRELIETTQNLESLEAELEQMDKKASKLEKVSKVTGELSEKTKKLSTAAAVGVAGMVAMATKAGKTSDELLTLSRNTGLTVEEIQKLQYAADLVDVDFDAMTGSITKLTKQMGSGSKVFSKLGVSIKNADGSMRNATDVWYDALDALSKIENETERDAVSMELFGKSAMELSGIVDDGGKALKELGDEAEATGLILGKDAVEDAGKFQDALDKLKGTATQAFVKAGAALADSLVPMLEKLVDVVSKVLSWFANLDGTTQTIILTILALVAALSPVLGLISTLTSLAAGLNVAMLPMIGTIGLIVAGIAAVIAIGVALYKNWDAIKQKATELWNNLKQVWGNIKNFIVETVTNIKNKVVEIFTNIKNSVVNIWNNIKSSISGVITSIKETALSIFSNIKQGIVDRFNALKEKVTSIWQGIKNAITAPIEAAKNFIHNAIEKIKSFFKFEWSLPKLKLPHFHWEGDFSLIPLRIPKLSVEWYDKAMENGMILKDPTIFGMKGGSLLAGGESGDEAVVGVNSLKNMIKEAIAQQTATLSGMGGDITIPVFIGNERLDTLVVKAAQRANYRSGGR